MAALSSTFATASPRRANRHCKAGTPVRIEVRAEDGRVVFEVNNRGPGLRGSYDEARDLVAQTFDRSRAG